jgi:hypothetical protein
MLAIREGGSPAPRAAGRASNVFSSAGEHSKYTQRQRRIQAAEPACQAPPSRKVASVCGHLRVEAILHALVFDKSYPRSGEEAEWRGPASVYANTEVSSLAT